MPEATTPEHGRGRHAERPGDIPRAGWRDVLVRLWHRVGDDHLAIISAGTAFFALIAMVPAFSALISLYGLLFDPAGLARQLSELPAQLPRGARQALATWIGEAAESKRWHLALGAAGSLLITLWGASLGVRAMMNALNVAYGESEKRRFVARVGTALLLTLGALCVACIVLAAVIGLPAVRDGLGDRLRDGPLLWARWPVVALLFWASVTVLYRYGPSRAQPRWSWVSYGAIAATALWLGGSALLSWYVTNVASQSRTYTSVGFVVTLLVWFLLSAYSILAGATLNAELERQTRLDTTAGPERPLGQRGAHAADTVGRSDPQTRTDDR
jgi:membrane protein